MAEITLIEPNSQFIKEISALGGGSLNLCYQCGTCTGSCPSGRVTAFRVRKMLRKAQLGMRDDVLASDDLWNCTTCYTCYERCPRGVDIPGIVMLIRNIAVQEGNISPRHQKTLGNLLKTGHLVNLTDEFKAIRAKQGLDEIPPTVLKNTEGTNQIQKILKKTKFKKIIGVGGG